MKSLIQGLPLFLFLISSQALAGVDVDGVVRIEVGKNKNISQSDLWHRVWMLERAVAQLQERVFFLEANRPGSTVVSPREMTTCYVQTPFDGTFSATEPTETAAKAKALSACSARASTVHCDEGKLKWGR